MRLYDVYGNEVGIVGQDTVEELKDKLESLQKQNELMRACLEIYSDQPEFIKDNGLVIGNLGGAIAKGCLKKIEEMTK
jgi:hypothetical protein